MSATGEFFTTSENGGIVRHPHLFAIPTAVVVGINKMLVMKYVCARCGKKFFPSTREEIVCSSCVGKRIVRPIEMSRVFRVKVIGDGSRNLPSTARTALNFKQVMERDNCTCVYCEYSPNICEHIEILHIDHIIPTAYGGGNQMSNLVVACRWCNSKAGHKLFSSLDTKRQYLVAKRKDEGLPFTRSQWEELNKIGRANKRRG